MKMRVSFVVLFTAAFLSVGCTSKPTAQPLDQRLVGLWEGMREQNNGCQFLAWRMQLNTDGTFLIAFFRDQERTRLIQVERGRWTAANGRSELKTDGVGQTEVYQYTLKGSDAVHYVNTVKDPTADCQADYEFTEYRVSR
jgi:hypothetical protein